MTVASSHVKIGIFTCCLCLVSAVEVLGLSFLQVYATAISLVLTVTFLLRKIARRSLELQSSAIALRVRGASAQISALVYFAFYAVSLVDLEFSALIFLSSIVLGTLSCLISGPWIAFMSSALLLTSDRLYLWQQRRIDQTISTGRDFLFWCVSLLKPPA